MRALAFLAKKDAPSSVREISEKEDLPLEYLEKILQTLRKADLVVSQRGVGGGYALAHLASEITLHDILAELEGPFFTLPCFSSQGCDRAHSCHTKGVWDTINKTLDDQLQKVTLKDITT